MLACARRELTIKACARSTTTPPPRLWSVQPRTSVIALPVARVANLAATVDMLKKNGVWIFGTDGSGESYDRVKMDGPVGLVIGSEGFGMSRLMKEKCDFLLSLPMAGKITSLNASVAAGIFMYEIVRQRNK